MIGAGARDAYIATGEEQDTDQDENGKDEAAQALGRTGGAVRAKKLTKEQRTEIARKAAAKRWGNP